MQKNGSKSIIDTAFAKLTTHTHQRPDFPIDCRIVETIVLGLQRNSAYYLIDSSPHTSLTIFQFPPNSGRDLSFSYRQAFLQRSHRRLQLLHLKLRVF